MDMRKSYHHHIHWYYIWDIHQTLINISHISYPIYFHDFSLISHGFLPLKKTPSHRPTVTGPPSASRHSTEPSPSSCARTALCASWAPTRRMWSLGTSSCRGETMGKPWEKPWKSHGKAMGKPWESPKLEDFFLDVWMWMDVLMFLNWWVIIWIKTGYNMDIFGENKSQGYLHCDRMGISTKIEHLKYR